MQFVIATFFGYYPESPLSWQAQRAVNSRDEHNRQDAIKSALTDMKENDVYKLCTISRHKKYKYINDGHSMLIVKTDTNKFSFFDPNVGYFSNLKDDDIVQMIEVAKLSNGSTEIALMDNKRFVDSKENYIQNAITKYTSETNNQKVGESDTLLDQFINQLQEKGYILPKHNTFIDKDALKINNLETLKKSIADILSDNQIPGDNKKQKIIEAIKTELSKNKNEDENKSKVITAFCTFLETNHLLEAKDFQKDHAKLTELHNKVEALNDYHIDETSNALQYKTECINQLTNIKNGYNDLTKIILQNQSKVFTSILAKQREEKNIITSDNPLKKQSSLQL